MQLSVASDFWLELHFQNPCSRLSTFIVGVLGQLLFAAIACQNSPLRIQHNNTFAILVITMCSVMLIHADGGSHCSWLQSKYKQEKGMVPSAVATGAYSMW
jgi:hypothetical protein